MHSKCQKRCVVAASEQHRENPWCAGNGTADSIFLPKTRNHLLQASSTLTSGLNSVEYIALIQVARPVAVELIELLLCLDKIPVEADKLVEANLATSVPVIEPAQPHQQKCSSKSRLEVPLASMLTAPGRKLNGSECPPYHSSRT